MLLTHKYTTYSQQTYNRHATNCQHPPGQLKAMPFCVCGIYAEDDTVLYLSTQPANNLHNLQHTRTCNQLSTPTQLIEGTAILCLWYFVAWHRHMQRMILSLPIKTPSSI